MYNRTDGNRDKKPPFNHGNYQQGCRPVTSESRGQNRRITVSPVDNPASNSPRNNASCSSTAVQQRVVVPKPYINDIPPKTFDELIDPSKFIRMNRMSCRFGNDYNGKQHCVYATLVKNFKAFIQQPFNTPQMEQLLLLLQTHHPKCAWTGISMVTAFHSWTLSGLFIPNNDLSQDAILIQKSLLKSFLYQILNRSKKKPSFPGIDAQGASNMMTSLAKLADRNMDLEKATLLKPTVIAVCLYVKTIAKTTSTKEKDCLNPQEVANIISSMAVLGDCVLLDMKNSQNIKDTMITLLTLMETKAKSKEKKDQFNPLEVASMLSAIIRIVTNRLLIDTAKLNESVAVLWSLIATMKDLFTIQNLGNLLCAMGELGCYGMLDMNNTQKLSDTMITLLHNVEIKAKSKEKKDLLYPQINNNILYSIMKLTDIGLLKVTKNINHLVAMLLPLVTEHSNYLSTKGLSNILCTMTKLGDCGLNSENKQKIEDTMISLLPCAETKLKEENETKYFEPTGIAVLLWIIAKLACNSNKLSTTKFNNFLALLFPLIAKQKDNFSISSLRNIVWSLAKMIDTRLDNNNTQTLENTVITLWPILEITTESKKEEDRFSPYGIASLIWAVARLAHNMLLLNTAKIKNLVVALLYHVDEQKNLCTTHSIANLLWSVADLGELIEIQRAVTLSISLMDAINTDNQFNNQELGMTLWGILVCIARSFLIDSADESDVLKNHIKQLLIQMKDKLLNINKDELLEIESNSVTIVMASIWLGDPCFIIPSYKITESKYQSYVFKALSKKFPSLKIEKEKSLHTLPPVDLYLPEHRLVIEVQGPYHYTGDDFQTRNGSTLLKIALLKKLRYEVIEIPMPKGCESKSIQEKFDKIQKKIQSGETADNRSISPISDSEQESSDDEYFTANEDNDSSDEHYFNDTNLLTKTEQQTTAWQIVGKKNKGKLSNKSKK